MPLSSLPSPLRRFEGARGKALLVSTLEAQRLVVGDRQLAETLVDAGLLKFFEPGESIITQGDWTNEIYLIITGSVGILVSGNHVASRASGEHVGEMSLIDPSKPRSATVVAAECTVCLYVSEQEFSRIASEFPNLWRRISVELADRLRQRGNSLREVNKVPVVFLASASESLDVARAIQDNLDGDSIRVILWTEGVFKLSEHTLESLETAMLAADFAVAVLSPDDLVRSRRLRSAAPRDNTIYELGLFSGAIGRHRTFVVRDARANVKLPSDLAGVTYTVYHKTGDNTESIDTNIACNAIRERVGFLGPR